MHQAHISLPSLDDRSSSRPQFPSVKWASLESGGLEESVAGRWPASEAGAGGWGQRCESAGRAFEGLSSRSDRPRM